MPYHYKIYGVAKTDTNQRQTICGQDFINLDIFVGNSKNNSENIINVNVSRNVDSEGNFLFQLRVDNKPTQVIKFNPKTKEFS